MIRVVIRGLGELLITVGVVVLLFAAYEVYGKAFEVHADQSRLDSALDRQWGQQAPPAPGKKQVADKPIPGQGVARLYIPRLAKEWVVVEGVSKHDIKLAPGHYPDSQLPGQVGNFAETRTSWDVYRVTRNHIIRPTQVSVVAKNPDHPGTPPTRKLLTLTTCNPKWDNYQRLVIQAELTREDPRGKGRPAELGGL
jgi:sortase A